jgi:hypothetical protein
MLKDNWTQDDKLKVTDYNNIFSTMLKILENLNIERPELKSKTRNIQIGDDLSGEELFLDIGSEVEYEWLVTENVVPIITTENNLIGECKFENTENYKTIDYEGIAINFKQNLEKNQDFLYLVCENNTKTEINLKNYKLPENFGIVTSINTSSAFYNLIKINTYKKSMGDFLYIEDLQLIEDNIEKLNKFVEEKFKKKQWTSPSFITNDDLNRWCHALNLADIFYKYSDYKEKTYKQLKNKTYNDILKK